MNNDLVFVDRTWLAGMQDAACSVPDVAVVGTRIVPASFHVETFRASGVRVPIRLMPLGVDVDYFNPDITAFRPSTRFTFLSVFEWAERKAPELLLRAYCDEFKESEDVLLLLSVFNRDPTIDVRAKTPHWGCPPARRSSSS